MKNHKYLCLTPEIMIHLAWSVSWALEFNTPPPKNDSKGQTNLVTPNLILDHFEIGTKIIPSLQVKKLKQT